MAYTGSSLSFQMEVWALHGAENLLRTVIFENWIQTVENTNERKHVHGPTLETLSLTSESLWYMMLETLANIMEPLSNIGDYNIVFYSPIVQYHITSACITWYCITCLWCIILWFTCLIIHAYDVLHCITCLWCIILWCLWYYMLMMYYMSYSTM